MGERTPARTPARTGRGPLVAVVGSAVVLLALVVVRGPVVLLAAATVAVLAAAVLGVAPLLRDDGIDWTWRPGRDEEVPPETGIANLRRLLVPVERDTTADAELHDLVRTLADERAGRRGAGGPDRDGAGALARYLAGPPRRLTLEEADAVVTDLESLSPTKETP